jgi:hypothetical protein
MDLDILTIVVVTICLVSVIVSLFFYRQYVKKFDVTTPRPILTHDGNIMSLNQYKTVRKTAMKKKRASPLTKTVNASQDITK